MASSVSSTTSTSTSTGTRSGSSNSSGVTVVALKRSLVPVRWQQAAVRVIGMSECKEAALTLAHAFASDDYAQYLVESESDDSDSSDSGSEENKGGSGGMTADEARWKLHVDILTYTVASHVMSGLVTAVGPECDSVALWYEAPIHFHFHFQVFISEI